MKAAFSLYIAGKMQSLSLLRFSEKFAEIHRQVSLCSLTTVGLGVPACFFGLNPFQLQNAPHSALKLLLFFEMGLRWAAAQTPAGNTVPCTLSPLRGIELGFQIKKPERYTPRLSSSFYGYHSLFETEINPSS